MTVRKVYRFALHLVGSIAACVSCSLILMALFRHVFQNEMLISDQITNADALHDNITWTSSILAIVNYFGIGNYINFASNQGSTVFVQGSNDCHLSKHWKSHATSDIKTLQHLSEISNMPIWGSYRPEIFFGMKSRTEKVPTVSGIAWNSALRSNIRHKTEDVTNFYWTRHNGKTFGEELIKDEPNNAEIKASFLIRNFHSSSTSAGKGTSKDTSEQVTPSWTQRVEVASIDRNVEAEKNLFFYYGNEIAHRQSSPTLKNTDYATFSYFHEHLSSNSHVLNYGGRSETSGNFILKVQVIEKGTEVCVNEQSCDGHIGSPTRVTYHMSTEIDASSIIDGLASEIERMPFMPQSTKFKYINSDGDLSNEILPLSSFIIVKASGSSDFVLKVTLFEHLTYKGKFEFEHLAISLDEERDNMNLLMNERNAFDAKFENTYQLARLNFTDEQVEQAKITLSSLLGGIGYFQGSPEIGDGIDVSKPIEDASSSSPESSINQGDPISLLTCTPSRTVFPRGFLWDEGFHQLLVSSWDPDLSLLMLRHWFRAMYTYTGPNPSSCAGTTSHITQQQLGGWIPREMILGDVARSRVPREFITQRVNIANPPSLLLAIESIINHCNRLKGDLELHDNQLKVCMDNVSYLYPFVEKWVLWLMNTQRSTNSQMVDTFRWRGRSSDDKKQIPNTLASGLDDYPRSVVASADEAHVDLMAWIVMCCKVMVKFGLFLQRDVSFFKSKEELYFNALNKWHWTNGSSETDTSHALLPGYYDIGLDHKMNRFDQFAVFRCANETDKTMVDVQVPLAYLQSGQSICPESHPKRLYSHRDERGKPLIYETLLLVPRENLKNQLIPRIGYVNIFPFILQLIPVDDETKISATLDFIENPDYLWTDYGLRSIAKSDMFYMKRNAEGDAPYWRGPIWICVNYLTLKALYHYKLKKSTNSERLAVEIYSRLRKNIMTTVLTSMKETGYLWEHYDESTGKGTRGHPFTGWTSLIVNIMAEKYD